MRNSLETDGGKDDASLWPLVHVGIPTRLSVVNGDELSRTAREYITTSYEKKPLVLPVGTRVSVNCVGEGGNSISLGDVALAGKQRVRPIAAGRMSIEPYVINAVQVVFVLDSAVRRQFAQGMRRRDLTDTQEEERLAGLFLIQNGLGYRLEPEGIMFKQVRAIHLTALSDPHPELNPGLTPRLSFREMRAQGRING